MKEVWKDIKGYEGIYQISNYGRVKSLTRVVKGKNNSKRKLSEKIMIPGLDGSGYEIITLRGESQRAFHIHHLVWDSFRIQKRQGRKVQVDHVDGDKRNNSINNLQLLNNRQNVSKYHKERRELPTGVEYYNKKKKRVRARIYIDGKYKHLGCFDNITQASNAYQKALRGIGG